MSAGGGQGNWGPWPVNPRSGGSVLPGEVKIDAGDGNPGYLGAKVTTPPQSGLAVGTDPGPPSTLTIRELFPDKFALVYSWSTDGNAFSAIAGYVFTSSFTELAALGGEMPVPPGFIPEKVLLGVNVVDNTLVPAAGPPPVVNWSVIPTRNGSPIVGCSLVFTSGQLGYHSNSTTIVGAADDTFGLTLDSLGLDPAPTVQDISFNGTLYILGKGSSV